MNYFKQFLQLVLCVGFSLLVQAEVVAQIEDTDAQLQAFYQAQGGRTAFPEHYQRAIEAFLYAQDELAAGQRQAAKQRVDAVFNEMPYSADIWADGATLFDLNVGHPIAYYGLRMLDQLLALEQTSNGKTITMTAVVPLCADVTRPTLPNLEPETLRRNIDDRILADNAKVLRQSTDLFRRWLSAIADGANVRLNVHVVEECTTVGFDLAPNVIFSYPDTNSLLAGLPFETLAETDIWWIVVPSGVPGDGSDFDRFFITGGMGVADTGAPVFLSDDAWFLRKPTHLGTGDYSEAERRLYMPQWFQHEFMHNLFRIFPEFGLEESGHQWFDRTTWPGDFEGVYEPDYYAEALRKRLLGAQPSIYQRVIDRPAMVDFSTFPLKKLTGKFERQPVENEYHQVTVTIDEEGVLTWTNAAGVSWQLMVVDRELHTVPDSIYGERNVLVDLDARKNVTTLIFLGENYVRIDDPPVIDDDSEQCFVIRASNGSVVNFCL